MATPEPLLRRRAQPLLGTLVDITVAGHTLAAADQAIDAAFTEIHRLHVLLGSHAPDNALAQLNRAAHRHPVAVDDDLRAVLGAALRFAAASDGAFDPCVGATLERLGGLPRHGDVPPAAGTWRDIVFSADGRVRFRQPLRIDLGGIAKGYAVDRAVEVLAAHGIRSGLVNAGGDLRALGTAAWPVQVRHPCNPHGGGHSLTLRGTAIATSACYFSRREHLGNTVSDLIRPQDGAPFTGPSSVSVGAPDCMSADALTKVVLFAHAARTQALLRRHAARAWILAGQDAR